MRIQDRRREFNVRSLFGTIPVNDMPLLGTSFEEVLELSVKFELGPEVVSRTGGLMKAKVKPNQSRSIARTPCKND